MYIPPWLRFRFALLSAVVSNADELAAWLHIDSARVVKGNWRPSVKRLSRWTEDGKLKLHAGDDPLRDQPSQVLGETDLPWPQSGFYSTNNFGPCESTAWTCGVAERGLYGPVSVSTVRAASAVRLYD